MRWPVIHYKRRLIRKYCILLTVLPSFFVTLIYLQNATSQRISFQQTQSENRRATGIPYIFLNPVYLVCLYFAFFSKMEIILKLRKRKIHGTPEIMRTSCDLVFFWPFTLQIWKNICFHNFCQPSRTPSFCNSIWMISLHRQTSTGPINFVFSSLSRKSVESRNSGFIDLQININ